MTSLSSVELSGNTAAARKYWTFEQYDLQRKMSHSRLSNDPWPPMTRDEYNVAIASCPKGYGPVNDGPPIPPHRVPTRRRTCRLCCRRGRLTPDAGG